MDRRKENGFAKKVETQGSRVEKEVDKTTDEPRCEAKEGVRKNRIVRCSQKQPRCASPRRGCALSMLQGGIDARQQQCIHPGHTAKTDRSAHFPLLPCQGTLTGMIRKGDCARDLSLQDDAGGVFRANHSLLVRRLCFMLWASSAYLQVRQCCRIKATQGRIAYLRSSLSAKMHSGAMSTFDEVDNRVPPS